MASGLVYPQHLFVVPGKEWSTISKEKPQLTKQNQNYPLKSPEIGNFYYP